MLRGLNVVHTIVDGPQGAENSVPAVWKTTHHDYALLKLHGRNTETYNAPVAIAAERFSYECSDAELRRLVEHASPRLASAMVERLEEVMQAFGSAVRALSFSQGGSASSRSMMMRWVPDSNEC